MAEGYKDWSAGDILTAADLEDYTVKQSVMRFADSSARTTALSGVLAEGMMSYLKDTDTVEVYDGSAWAAVGGGGGLVFISRTTIGSAVSSVTVSDAFSADYDSYKIVVQGGAGSTDLSLRLTLGSTTTGYYYSYWVIGYNASFSSASLFSDGQENATYFSGGQVTTNGITATIDIHQPYNSDQTWFNTVSPELGTGSANAFQSVGWLNDTTSYTAFTLTTSTGTVTGGTIDVYGYAKA